jgi:hypothetical protein
MYTATILKKEFIDGKVFVSVSYPNGTDTLVETISATDLEVLKSNIRARVDSLNKANALSDTLTTGSIDLTPPADTITPAETEKQAWFNQYSKWVKIKTTLIDTGILTGNETQLVNLKSQVQNGFKASYINDII